MLFGKAASIGMVLAMASLCGVAHGAAAEMSPLNPAYHRDLDVPQVGDHPAVSALPHTTNDTPTAPLPPALWPGLWLLASLGGVKVVISARRRLARG